jgi:PAS domain-containing protein
MEVAAKIVIKEDGTPDKIIAIVREIEERKKMEVAVKESEKKYRLITENTFDLV